jgi:hypothetical protein
MILVSCKEVSSGVRNGAKVHIRDWGVFDAVTRRFL